MRPHLFLNSLECRVVSVGGGTTNRNGFFQNLSERLGRGSPAEGFTRSTVELVRDLVEAGLAETSKAVTFGKVLAEQAVGVLVGAALPGAAGVAEVDGDPGVDSEAFVLCHLRALVPGQ